jgi:hypothetical protein
MFSAVYSLYTKWGKSWSWSWSYGSWIYNYLYNQCRSPLKLWIRTRSWRGVLDTTLCDKVFSNLRQVGGFLQTLRFPPPIKLTASYNWNIVESGVKHHKPTYTQNVLKSHFKIFYTVNWSYKKSWWETCGIVSFVYNVILLRCWTYWYV